MSRLTHGSLFSGIGGSEVAAEMMGWENVFHCDINPFGRKVLDYWYPNSKSYEDITKTDFTEWRGKIDVLTGGFPCQPFSVAGKRKGADDNRYLWPHMLRAIREIRPAWVVGENVAGILTMVQPGKEVEVGCQTSLFGGDNRKRILLRQEYVVETICKDLEREGYSVQPLLIPACAVGAPHRRDRVFFVAHANSDGGSEETEWEFKQAEKNDEQSESLFHSGTSSHRTDSRAEDVRQEREDTILSDGIATDTDRHRFRFGKNKQKQFTTCKRTADLGIIREDGASTNTNGEDGSVVADSQCTGSGQVLEEIQSEKPDGHSIDRNGCEWDAAYPDSKLSSQWMLQGEKGRHKQKIRIQSLHSRSNWQDFPTQSPVCRGNDGLPFNVGDLTIPFTRWRQESVKAYGNAIVPQVMYEIFRAIEAIENEYSI